MYSTDEERYQSKAQRDSRVRTNLGIEVSNIIKIRGMSPPYISAEKPTLKPIQVPMGPRAFIIENTSKRIWNAPISKRA